MRFDSLSSSLANGFRDLVQNFVERRSGELRDGSCRAIRLDLDVVLARCGLSGESEASGVPTS